jgi:hypothetical protein
MVAIADRRRCFVTTLTSFTAAHKKNRGIWSASLARSIGLDRNRWYREAETPDEVSGRGLLFLDQGQKATWIGAKRCFLHCGAARDCQ